MSPGCQGYSVLSIGVVVLIGWQFDIALLKSLHPSLVSMKANTALGFILAGISLLFRNYEAHPSNHKSVYRANIFAVAVAFIGGATLFEYGSGINLGIDQLLYHEPMGTVDTLAPGRMAPVTAFCFLLLGGILTVRPKSERAISLAQAMTVLVFFTAYVSVLGYVYRAPNISGLGRGTVMAVHTALTFLVLSAGCLFLWPQRGVSRLMSSHSIVGSLTRRLLPTAILIPTSLGLLKLAGQDYGLFDEHFGDILVIVCIIVIFSLFIVWGVKSIEKYEIECRRSEEELNKFFNFSIKQETWLILADGSLLLTQWNCSGQSRYTRYMS